MRPKFTFGIVSFLIVMVLILSGCGGGSSSTGGTGTLKLSLTDAPAAENFSAVNITISEVRISQSSAENAGGWITLSNTPVTVDLLKLNNAELQSLGIKDLPAGQYNQIRFYVSKVEVVVNGETQNVELTKLPSGMLRTVGSFTIQDGITTELVIDFNVAQSIVHNENGSGYILKPVTRLIAVNTTGSITGTVTLDPVPLEKTLITVSTTDSVGNTISTICRDDGTFTLGYLPAGSYNLTIEAIGYNADTTRTNLVVTAGNATPIQPVTLTQTAAPVEPAL
ncbi:MAG TPA: DUF4382 domain-containing protein [Bacillota bacterium]|nr:DUF4382 domain-containing protein [Bacillota bacterium]